MRYIHRAFEELKIYQMVLQRYVLENYSKFKLQGLKINVRDNKDRYLDPYFVLDNGKEILSYSTV